MATVDNLEYSFMERFDVGRLVELCDIHPRLLTITGLIRTWLALHWADGTNIRDAIIRPYTWTDDPRTSQITIESVGEFEPEQTEKRPAILLNRGDWDYEKVGIDDRAMPEWQRPGQTPTQGAYYEHLSIGSHTVWAVSRVYGEVERVAAEAADFLTDTAPIVRSRMGLHKLVVAKIGAPGKLKEARENFAVPITVAYAISHQWVLQGEAPYFRGANLSVS